MADSNAENIGGVSISVGADYSGLQQDFQDAIALAVSQGATLREAIIQVFKLPDTSTMEDAIKAMGEAMAAAGAKMDGAAGSAKTYSDAAQAIIDKQAELDGKLSDAQAAFGQLQQAFDDGTVGANTLARAADDLQSAFDKANPAAIETGNAIHDAGEHAHEAESRFAGMAEQLVAFGEALAVTEALKEFGLEALHAFDSMQKATNSLTALTGSAETAKEVIEGVEKIAATQPFSFPELAGAAQKMAAFGIEADKIPDLLTAAGNASRATGNSFDGIAGALERVSITGQVTGRQLVQLGVNWEDLAQAAGKSVSETQALLKKGGQDAAADLDLLLKATQEKFGDFSKVPLSIGEQWIVLQNQIHTVFADIGAALAPIIQQIVGWLQTDLIPAIKAATAWFNGLPTPIKDIAVVLGLLAAAIPAVAVAVGGFGLAVAGISAALPALTGLIGGLDVALVPLGIAFSEVLIPLGLLAAAVAAFHFSGLDAEASTFAENLKGDFEGIGDLLSPLGDAIKSIGGVLTDIWGTEFHAVAESAKGIITDLGTAWGLLGTETSGELTVAKTGMDALIEAFKTAHPEVQKFEDGFTRVGQVLGDTTPKQEAFFAGVSAGGPQVLELARGLALAANALDFLGAHYQVMTDAMTKGNPVMKENADRMHDAAQEAMRLAGNFGDIAAHAESAGHPLSLLQAQTEATKISMENLRDRVTSTQEALVKIVQAYNQGKASADDVAKAQDAAAAATKQLETNMNSLAPVVTNVHHATKDFVDTSNLLIDAEQGAALADYAHQLKLESLTQHVIDATKNLAVMEDLESKGLATKDQVAKALDKVTASTKALETEQGNLKPPIGILAPDASDWLAETTASLDAMLWPIQKLPPYIRQATDDFKDLGLKVDDVSGAVTTKLLTAFDDLMAKQTPTLAQAEMAWGKVSGAVNKLSQTDLPEALRQYDLYIAKLEDLKAPIGEIQVLQEKELQLEIQMADQRGTSASEFIIKLDNLKQRIADQRAETNLLGDAWTGVLKTWNDGFANLGKALADNIVAGNDWAKTWHSFMQGIEKEIMEELVGVAFKALRGEIDGLVSSLVGTLKGALGIAGAGVQGLSSAAAGAAQGAQALHDAVNATVGPIGQAATAAGQLGTTASGAASSVASSASSFLGTFSAISAGVSAVTGVIGLFQNAAMQTTMKLVELNTRISAIVEQKELPLSNQIAVEQEGTLQDISTHTATLTDGLTQIINLLSLIGQQITGVSGGVQSMGPVSMGGSVSLGGDALGQLKYQTADLDTIKAAVTGIWVDSNLEVQGLQNINLLLQGILATTGDGYESSKQASADFIGLFTNTSQSAKDQWAASFALAQQHFDAAKNTADKIAALKEEAAANQHLLLIAQKEGNADAIAKYTAASKDIADKIAALQGSGSQTATNTGQTTQGIRDASAAAESGRQKSDQAGRDALTDLKNQILINSVNQMAAMEAGNTGLAAYYAAIGATLQQQLAVLQSTQKEDAARGAEQKTIGERTAGAAEEGNRQRQTSSNDAAMAMKALIEHIASLKQQIIDTQALADAAVAAGDIGMAANFSAAIKAMKDELAGLEGTAQGTREGIRTNTRDGADSSKRVEDQTRGTQQNTATSTEHLGNIREETHRSATSGAETSTNTSTTAANTRETAAAAGATRDQTRRVADSSDQIVTSNRALVDALTKTTANVDTSVLLQNIWEATNHSRVTLEAIYTLTVGNSTTLQGIMMGSVIMAANSWQLVRDADQSLAAMAVIRDTLAVVLEDANHIRVDSDALVDQGRLQAAANTHELVDLDGILLGSALTTAAVQSIDHAVPSVRADIQAIIPALTAEANQISAAMTALSGLLTTINTSIQSAATSISQALSTGLQSLGAAISGSMASVSKAIGDASAGQIAATKASEADIIAAIAAMAAAMPKFLTSANGNAIGGSAPGSYTGGSGSGGSSGTPPPKYGPGSPGYKSPYEQTGSADPKNYVENLTQGSIEQIAHDNAEAIAGYQLAYRNYVLNMSSYEYIPPERRIPPVPPLEEILGPPDKYGVPYPIPGSNYVTEPGPAVPYIGPAQPYAEGGYVPRDMMIWAHAGEWVLNQKQVQGQMPLPAIPALPSAPTGSIPMGYAGGGSSTAGHTTISFGDIHLHGVQDPQSLAKALMNYLRTASPKFATMGN